VVQGRVCRAGGDFAVDHGHQLVGVLACQKVNPKKTFINVSWFSSFAVIGIENGGTGQCESKLFGPFDGMDFW
jgi:hypothetical protein